MLACGKLFNGEISISPSIFTANRAKFENDKGELVSLFRGLKQATVKTFALAESQVKSIFIQ